MPYEPGASPSAFQAGKGVFLASTGDRDMAPRTQRNAGRNQLGHHAATAHIGSRFPRQGFHLRSQFFYQGNETCLRIQARIGAIQTVDI